MAPDACVARILLAFDQHLPSVLIPAYSKQIANRPLVGLDCDSAQADEQAQKRLVQVVPKAHTVGGAR